MQKNDAPLDLMVHNLPSIKPSSQGMGRWKMMAIFLLCATPVIASYLSYYVFRPTSTVNFGVLIQPQQAMPPSLVGVSLAGQTQPLGALRGQWLLVSVGSGACDQACQDRLVFQRQLRETLGRDKTKLDWGWLIVDDTALAPQLQERLSDPTLLAQGFFAFRVRLWALNAWFWPSPAGDASNQQAKQAEMPLKNALEDYYYLIDPQGNYMMRFPAKLSQEEAAKVKRDISKLLRAASFWDKPGREHLVKP